MELYFHYVLPVRLSRATWQIDQDKQRDVAVAHADGWTVKPVEWWGGEAMGRWGGQGHEAGWHGGIVGPPATIYLVGVPKRFSTCST